MKGKGSEGRTIISIIESGWGMDSLKQLHAVWLIAVWIREDDCYCEQSNREKRTIEVADANEESHSIKKNKDYYKGRKKFGWFYFFGFLTLKTKSN